MACRVIYRRRKYDSISYEIMGLHWLKVNERVVFKVVTLMYKCMDETALEYLVELVCKEHHCTLWFMYMRENCQFQSVDCPKFITHHSQLWDLEYGIVCQLNSDKFTHWISLRKN